MWYANYIIEIQKQLIEKYEFTENPDKPGCPLNVPDGEYPMEIDGEPVKITIKDGIIHVP